MSVINGSLFNDIIRFHNPRHQANAAVIVIDEINRKWYSESYKNYIIRMRDQQTTLRFCKNLGCPVIVVHERKESNPRHIYSIIKKPDFSCVKQADGVLEFQTKPPLMDFINSNKITSLVLMGGSHEICVRKSLTGGCYQDKQYSGLLTRQMTVLSSPSLLGPYMPEIYGLEPNFGASEIYHEHTPYKRRYGMKWPFFTLHPGMRFYTKIQDDSSLVGMMSSQLDKVRL